MVERKVKLTRKQSWLLVRIAAIGAGTVESLCEADGPGIREVQRKLAYLEKAGLIERHRLYPEYGTQSKHYWYLTPQGALQAGYEGLYEPRPPEQAQELLPIRVRPGKGLSSAQATTLTLLAEMKQLTTEQINSYLFPEKGQDATSKILKRLRKQKYVSSGEFTEGRRLYWAITEKGASVIDRACPPHSGRMPSRETLEYRKDTLAVRKQVEHAGWYFIDGRATDRTGEVQSILRKSVLNKEREELVRLMSEHRPLEELEQRVEMHNRGEVGLIVPENIQDCVAYRPGLPAQTALLMINPSYSNDSYWLRRPHTKAGEWPGEARAARYRRLTEYLPVYVVTQSAEMLVRVGKLLEGSGYRTVLVSELSKELKEQYRGALRAAQSS